MKVTFSIWEREQLALVIGNAQISGGIMINEIDMALNLKRKLAYSGSKDDLDFDTTLTLSAEELTAIKGKAFSVPVWPPIDRTKQLKERIEEYAPSD